MFLLFLKLSVRGDSIEAYMRILVLSEIYKNYQNGALKNQLTSLWNGGGEGVEFCTRMRVIFAGILEDYFYLNFLLYDLYFGQL